MGNNDLIHRETLRQHFYDSGAAQDYLAGDGHADDLWDAINAAISDMPSTEVKPVPSDGYVLKLIIVKWLLKARLATATAVCKVSDWLYNHNPFDRSTK